MQSKSTDLTMRRMGICLFSITWGFMYFPLFWFYIIHGAEQVDESHYCGWWGLVYSLINGVFFILDYFLYVIHDAEQVDEPHSVDGRLSSRKPGVRWWTSIIYFYWQCILLFAWCRASRWTSLSGWLSSRKPGVCLWSNIFYHYWLRILLSWWCRISWWTSLCGWLSSRKPASPSD